jgi:5'-3' exonuclease
VRVHLLDGTYELFRHHFGAARAARPAPDDLAATRGVVQSVIGLLEEGVTHLAVATDHVIESFRNDLWPGYKTGAGVPPELMAQFEPLEDALAALGVRVLPMVELEADDALAAAARVARDDPSVERVVVMTPDKDLAQCVRGQRVVQLDRRSGVVLDEDGVRAKYGVPPASIPDWLALVGDSADGFPGLPGWGRASSAAVLRRYGRLERIPERADRWDVAVRGAGSLAATLRERRDLALLFRELATLREDADIVASVEELRWRGPDDAGAVEDLAGALGRPGIADRIRALAGGAPLRPPAGRGPGPAPSRPPPPGPGAGRLWPGRR